MYPVERALWFIENRISGDISLQAIAASAGVSNHHLARAFGAATGKSLMRYEAAVSAKRRDLWPSVRPIF